MPYENVAKNAALDAIGNGAAVISLHTADPGAAGSVGEVTGGTPAYARKSTTWAAATNGTKTGAQVIFDVPANPGVPLTHFCVRTTTTGAGVVWYRGPLPAQETYGSQGTYAFTPTMNAADLV